MKHSGDDAVLTAGVAPTILVVEDEPGVRHFVERVLARFGYQRCVAATAAEALALADAHPEQIGMVISDAVLPDMSGRELVRRLRAARPDLPVLFISGYSRDDLVGWEIPEAEFLQKPFLLPELLAAVQRMLQPVGARG